MAVETRSEAAVEDRPSDIEVAGCRGRRRPRNWASRAMKQLGERSPIATAHGETLLASRLVDSFRVKNEGKRAMVDCQRAQIFGPGENGLKETSGSLQGSGLPK
jgi:hypothetical protein